MADFQPF